MTNNRWIIALAGVAIQVALGAVYAWSVFRVPLATRFGWNISQVTLTFTISIAVLGISAFFGGIWLNKSGPRIVAVVGGSSLRHRCDPRQFLEPRPMVAVSYATVLSGARVSGSLTLFRSPCWSNGFRTGVV